MRWYYVRRTKNIEVISGDGSELNISPVYDHISAEKPSIEDKKKNIVIPCTNKTYLAKQQTKSDQELNNSQEDSDKEQGNKENNKEKLTETISPNTEDKNDINQDNSSDNQEESDSNS